MEALPGPKARITIYARRRQGSTTRSEEDARLAQDPRGEGHFSGLVLQGDDLRALYDALGKCINQEIDAPEEDRSETQHAPR